MELIEKTNLHQKIRDKPATQTPHFYHLFFYHKQPHIAPFIHSLYSPASFATYIRTQLRFAPYVAYSIPLHFAAHSLVHFMQQSCYTKPWMF